MLLENAALTCLILPAVLRDLFLTGSVLKPIILALCEETACRSWSQGSTADEVACPKRALLIRQPNPTRMMCHKHLGFLWITLSANSQKFVSFLTQSSHASQNKRTTRRLCEEASVFILARITFALNRTGTLENFCTRFDKPDGGMAV